MSARLRVTLESVKGEPAHDRKKDGTHRSSRPRVEFERFAEVVSYEDEVATADAKKRVRISAGDLAQMGLTVERPIQAEVFSNPFAAMIYGENTVSLGPDTPGPEESMASDRGSRAGGNEEEQGQENAHAQALPPGYWESLAPLPRKTPSPPKFQTTACVTERVPTGSASSATAESAARLQVQSNAWDEGRMDDKWSVDEWLSLEIIGLTSSSESCSDLSETESISSDGSD